MISADLSQARWRKSSKSQPTGSCVEMAHLARAVAIRDSKNPGGPVLLVAPSALTALVVRATG